MTTIASIAFLFYIAASSLLTAIMEAFVEKQPTTMIHMLAPLVTKRLETLKLSLNWKLSRDAQSQYMESANQLLLLAAAQESV